MRSARNSWPKLSSLVLIWTFFGARAGAWGSEPRACVDALTLDADYLELMNSQPADAQLKGGVTELLSRALTPMLRNLSARVTGLTPAEVARFSQRIPAVHVRARRDLVVLPMPTGFDQIFVRQVAARVSTAREMLVGVSSQNQTTITRLFKAVLVVDQVLKSEDGAIFNDPALAGASKLLQQRTFSGNNMGLHMHFAGLSTLQAASQLTAEPPLGLSAEDMLQIIFTQSEDKPSLMVRYALMLPPALLGEYGSYNYFREPLRKSLEGGWMFNPDTRALLRANRDRRAKRGSREKYETGTGCPVAHGLANYDRSGLQFYLDAVYYVYACL